MKQRPTFLLINPWIYDFAAFDLYFKPLGLLSLAGNLKKSGCEILFLDCMDRLDEYFIKQGFIKNQQYGTGKFYYEVIDTPEILKFFPRRYKRYGLPYDEVRKRFLELSRRKIDGILMTSVMNYWYPGVFDMIRLVKEVFTDTPVFLGGIYATLLTDHAEKYSGADHVIPGSDMYSIINEIFSKTGQPHVSFEHLKVYKNQEEPLFDVYPSLGYLVAQLSSGCPFHCTYCASDLLCKKFQFKDISKVVQNLKQYIKKYNIENIAFYDDALLYDFNKSLKEFLLSFQGVPLNYHTPNGLHLKFITPETAEYLYRYNFKMLRLSLETSDPERQRSTGSKTTNNDFIRAVKNLQQAGYSKEDLQVYILFGLPDQDKREVTDTISFIKDHGATAKIVEYSLIPGTRDYQKYFQNKVIDPLLENNSVFYLKYTSLTTDDLLDLRILAGK
ncbi:MAG: radical SAM protein [Spirochaetes bacterium]|nr:radical SAM protein [Spirochaetota bacterium]